MAEAIISIGLNPFKKSNSIFASTAPKAPYGPNNKPKTNNSPTWGFSNPNSQKNVGENTIRRNSTK